MSRTDRTRGFVKRLTSDIDDTHVVRLLNDIKSVNEEIFKDFTSKDIKSFAPIISAIKLDPGAPVTVHGEAATFFAFVLKGSLVVTLPDDTQVTMKKGTTLGELSYFRKGVRCVDVNAKSPTVLGLFRFDDISKLGNTHPVLQYKLVHLLANAMMIRLTDPNRTLANSYRDAQIFGTARPDYTKQETLWLQRLPPKSDSRKSPTSSDEKKREPRIVTDGETGGRLGTDVHQSNLNITIFAQKKKLIKLSMEIDELEQQIETLNKKLSERDAELLSQQRISHEWADKNIAMQAEVLSEREARRSLQIEVNDLRVSMRTQYANTTQTLKTEIFKHKEQYDKLSNEYERFKSEHEDQVQEMQKEIDSFRNQLSEEKKKTHELMMNLHTAKQVSYAHKQNATEFEQLVKQLRGSLAEMEEKAAEMETWKKKADLYSSSWQVEKQRWNRKIQNMSTHNNSLSTDVSSYQKILKFVTVHGYVRNFMVRKRLKSIYNKMVELSTEALKEHISRNTKKSNSNQMEDMHSLTTRAARMKNGPPWGPRSRAPMHMLIKSLDDEMSTLADSVCEIRKQKHHWREMADSFFQRNVELTNQNLSHDGALYEALQKTGGLRENARKVARDHHRLVLELETAKAQNVHYQEQIQQLIKQQHHDEKTSKQRNRHLFARSAALRKRIAELETYFKTLSRRKQYVLKLDKQMQENGYIDGYYPIISKRQREEEEEEERLAKDFRRELRNSNNEKNPDPLGLANTTASVIRPTTAPVANLHRSRLAARGAKDGGNAGRTSRPHQSDHHPRRPATRGGVATSRTRRLRKQNRQGGGNNNDDVNSNSNNNNNNNNNNNHHHHYNHNRSRLVEKWRRTSPFNSELPQNRQELGRGYRAGVPRNSTRARRQAPGRTEDEAGQEEEERQRSIASRSNPRWEQPAHYSGSQQANRNSRQRKQRLMDGLTPRGRQYLNQHQFAPSKSTKANHSNMSMGLPAYFPATLEKDEQHDDDDQYNGNNNNNNNNNDYNDYHDDDDEQFGRDHPSFDEEFLHGHHQDDEIGIGEEYEYNPQDGSYVPKQAADSDAIKRRKPYKTHSTVDEEGETKPLFFSWTAGDPQREKLNHESASDIQNHHHTVSASSAFSPSRDQTELSQQLARERSEQERLRDQERAGSNNLLYRRKFNVKRINVNPPPVKLPQVQPLI